MENTAASKKAPKINWQSLADAAGHPKPDEKNEDAAITKRKPKRSALFKKFAFFDQVTKRTRESFLRVNGDEEEGQQQPKTENIERLPSLTTNEINEMAETFLQLRHEDPEEEESRNNSGHLPVANLVSDQDVTVVHINDDDDVNVHHGTVVMGFLVTDMTRKALREPIYPSMPWMNPFCLLITVASLLVILVVSLAVTLTNTANSGEIGVSLTTSASPTTSLFPSSSETFRPSKSMSPTISPSFSPSDHPSQHPSLSDPPTALPTMAPVTWIQVGTDVTDTANRENLGMSVALSANGNELRAAGEGVLLVYLLAGTNNWIIDEDLSSSMTGWGRVAVSLDGYTIVASDPDHENFRGKATVYRRVGAAWEQRGDPLIGEGNGFFGYAVTMNSNGTIVAVGAWGEGYVHVYRDEEETTSSDLANVAKIEVNDAWGFGLSMAMSADATRLIVGAPWTNIDGRSRTGAAYVYTVFPEQSLLQRLGGEKENDKFGYNVDTSSKGDVLAVATVGNYAKIYAADDSLQRRYSHFGDRIDGSAGSKFGVSLSLSADGTRLAIGAPVDDQNSKNSRRVFVYAIHPRRHQMTGEFKGDASEGGFGNSVSLSGDGTRVAVGAWGRNGGFVRVFESV